LNPASRGASRGCVIDQQAGAMPAMVTSAAAANYLQLERILNPDMLKPLWGMELTVGVT